MRRKIPSTTALAAFEAAARHKSFTLAGDELSLTQSAIGRQVANLEDFLGVVLFRRTKRGIALTEAGEHYSRAVRQRLEDVERDAFQVMARAAGAATLDVGVVPTFATHWLIPRLTRLRDRRPQLTVHLHARSRPFLFEEEKLDAAIYAAEVPWPGTESVELMRESMVVVCAPSLLRGRRSLERRIAELPLIQMTTRPRAWRDWLSSRGLDTERAMVGPRVELFSMAVQAAVHGLGAALVPSFFVEEALENGTLSSLGAAHQESGQSYFLSYPKDTRHEEEVIAFGSWLSDEVRAEEAPNKA